ncbi:MAG: B12-binding domain-containing radical SAM protein [Planctomycetes bacterium]|nr:B12-binding domain-containing radical SAM protein [Planctomycetota bacterium]
MRIALFNFCDELSGEGSRLIAACLKQAGHHVSQFFLPFYGTAQIEITPDLEALLGTHDLFAVSLYSCYEDRAIDVTRYLRARFPDKKIMWGGIHATARTKHSLQYCDIAARGECEEAIVELINKMERGEPYHDVQNFSFMVDGKLVNNPLRGLQMNLDVHPYPDYEIADCWILDEGRKILPLTEELMRKYHTVYYFDEPAYFVLATRGCPFVCTYCYNNYFVNTYNNGVDRPRKLRYRSVDSVLDEIKQRTQRYPFLKHVSFSDDDFFARKLPDLEYFAKRYKAEVGLTWGCSAIPASISQEKLELLIDCGMATVQIGIQSGSDRLNREIYKRFLPMRKVQEHLRILETFAIPKGVRVTADFIIDNPYETEDDQLETIKNTLELPKFLRTNIFTLTYYPGTEIYDKAVKDGVITGEKDTYLNVFNSLRDVKHSFLTYVFLLRHRARGIAPDWLMRMLISKPMRWLGKKLPDGVLQRFWGRWLFPKVAARFGDPMTHGSGSV